MVKKPTNKFLPTHDGSLFMWKGSQGCCDASDLGTTVDARIWNDACDSGFYIKSHKTGERKLFTCTDVSMDDEGDLAWAKYVSVDDNKIAVLVYND